MKDEHRYTVTCLECGITGRYPTLHMASVVATGHKEILGHNCTIHEMVQVEPIIILHGAYIACPEEEE